MASPLTVPSISVVGGEGSAAGREERRKALRYLSERRGQMRYDEYLARGLPIGSGRVEAACKTVVGRRLKCTGCSARRGQTCYDAVC